MTDVDDYFNTLEAALKAREAAPSEPTASEPMPPTARTPAAEPSLVAEAFAALLALEEGEPGAKPVRLVLGGGEPRLSDGFLDELARRVAERLKNV
jgi:hypothetical protein